MLDVDVDDDDDDPDPFFRQAWHLQGHLLNLGERADHPRFRQIWSCLQKGTEC